MIATLSLIRALAETSVSTSIASSRAEIKTGLHYFLPLPRGTLNLKRSEQSEASSKPRILISLGGSDPKCLTLKIVEAIRKRYPELLLAAQSFWVLRTSRGPVEQALGAGSTQILIDPHDFLQCIV